MRKYGPGEGHSFVDEGPAGAGLRPIRARARGMALSITDVTRDASYVTRDRRVCARPAGASALSAAFMFAKVDFDC